MTRASLRAVLLRGPSSDEAVYGTRCSTVLVTEALPGGARRTQVVERSVDARGRWLDPVRVLLP